jgi:hypothetical protein
MKKVSKELTDKLKDMKSTLKPVFSPSWLSDWSTCKLLFHLLHNLNVQVYGDLNNKMTFGSMVHAMEEAWDTGEDPSGTLKAWVKKHIKGGPGYSATQIPLVKQLTKEVTKVFNGGIWKDGRGKRTESESYPNWLERQKWSIQDVEKRTPADLGSVIIAPKSDQIVKTFNDRGEERWWVVDRKTTQRNDANWKVRWILDAQTTYEMLAAEVHYGQEFEGVMVSQISYSRQQRSNWTSSLPQEISKVTREDPRWITKNSPRLRALVENRLQSLGLEVAFHYENDLWPASGMETRACDFCEFRKFCRGELPFDKLKPRPLDEVALLNKKRADIYKVRRQNFLDNLREKGS